MHEAEAVSENKTDYDKLAEFIQKESRKRAEARLYEARKRFKALIRETLVNDWHGFPGRWDAWSKAITECHDTTKTSDDESVLRDVASHEASLLVRQFNDATSLMREWVARGEQEPS